MSFIENGAESSEELIQSLKKQVKDLWEENKTLNQELKELKTEKQYSSDKKDLYDNEMKDLKRCFEEAIAEAREARKNYLRLYNEILLWKNSQGKSE